MKKIMFERNDKPHIVPEEADSIIIGFQSWEKGQKYIDYGRFEDGYIVEPKPGVKVFIPGDMVYGFTDDRSDGSASWSEVLLVNKIGIWKRVNGMTMRYMIPGYRDRVFSTSMRLVYGYYIEK